DGGKTELRGVGGWLGFLVVVLGLLSPGRMVVETVVNLQSVGDGSQTLGSNWPAYWVITCLIAVAAVSGSVFLAYRLVYVQRRSTVGLVIKGLWLLALVPLLLDLMISLLLFPHLAELLLAPSLIGDIMKPVISATIWSLYLVKSRRVANTYVVDETEAKHIFG
ncbi:MAG: hypothetical protein CVT74_00335, partial [Alphaproteobacteria bacterium HGW-Alphaproteobacteria-13]